MHKVSYVVHKTQTWLGLRRTKAVIVNTETEETRKGKVLPKNSAWATDYEDSDGDPGRTDTIQEERT